LIVVKSEWNDTARLSAQCLMLSEYYQWVLKGGNGKAVVRRLGQGLCTVRGSTGTRT
jgi:hypothetical protein